LEEARARAWDDRVSTVFVGGGTPTLIDPSLFARSLRALCGMFDVEPGAEITVEANPDSVSTDALKRLRDAGVNRLSIGAQSFDDDVLGSLGRTHTSAEVIAAVEAARRAGLDNVSLDLIYGFEPLEVWRASLQTAIDLDVEHVSCYALTIEERTPFGKAVRSGRMRAPDDDALADKFELASEMLTASGFEHYEVSNWAKPGKRCAHNIGYWTQGDYLGLGVGAHSHRAGRRWWNTRALPSYLADPARAIAGEEQLDERARAEEWLSLRLRLAEGFDVAEAEERLGAICDMAALTSAGLGVVDGGMYRPTVQGMLLDNDVAGMILNAVPAPTA
ncbi:MAG: radical SAM family heme chaperone HemW, partial [Actinobacteria bacterium]|nr:radical SAM family heme chaperone HemW [Actinomycetota bacterium]